MSTDEVAAGAIDPTNKRRVSRRVAASGNGRSRRADAYAKRRAQNTTVVDFCKFEMASLLRYRKFFKVAAKANASKYELVGAVKQHFQHHPRLKDAEVVAAFLTANQRYVAYQNGGNNEETKQN